jgi:hypothetical protein
MNGPLSPKMISPLSLGKALSSMKSHNLCLFLEQISILLAREKVMEKGSWMDNLIGNKLSVEPLCQETRL